MSALLELDQVVKAFPHRRSGRPIHAVDGVSLTINRAETIGIAGESGCGKSTLARLALRLLDVDQGSVRFDGRDITRANSRELLPVRRRMQAVFQDPLASFNARESLREIMREPFSAHRLSPPGGVDARINDLLASVGLPDADLRRTPAQLSGGQLQRIAIARALALEPELIVGDEPTSALDPSIQAQIVNVFLKLQRERQVALLIISHDLDVLGHMADRLVVMYLGVAVETGPGAALMDAPLHPYTQALLSAAPTLHARRDRSSQRIRLPGDPPNPADVPPGCRFHPRCPIARGICQTTVPPLRLVGDDGRQVACHLAPDETQSLGIAIARARLGRPPASQHEPKEAAF